MAETRALSSIAECFMGLAPLFSIAELNRVFFFLFVMAAFDLVRLEDKL